jgi:hypothetical protein
MDIGGVPKQTWTKMTDDRQGGRREGEGSKVEGGAIGASYDAQPAARPADPDNPRRVGFIPWRPRDAP